MIMGLRHVFKPELRTWVHMKSMISLSVYVTFLQADVIHITYTAITCLLHIVAIFRK